MLNIDCFVFRISSYYSRKTGVDDIGLELRGELAEFECQLLERQDMVVIRGKVFIKFCFVYRVISPLLSFIGHIYLNTKVTIIHISLMHVQVDQIPFKF